MGGVLVGAVTEDDFYSKVFHENRSFNEYMKSTHDYHTMMGTKGMAGMDGVCGRRWFRHDGKATPMNMLLLCGGLCPEIDVRGRKNREARREKGDRERERCSILRCVEAKRAEENDRPTVLSYCLLHLLSDTRCHGSSSLFRYSSARATRSASCTSGMSTSSPWGLQ